MLLNNQLTQSLRTQAMQKNILLAILLLVFIAASLLVFVCVWEVTKFESCIIKNGSVLNCFLGGYSLY